MPIGAVITDQHGRVLNGHRLAHAEMNALVALPWAEIDPQVCILYTTTEPCALCIGAVRMMRIREVRYASRFAAAGSVALLDVTPFMRRGRVRVSGPPHAGLEAVVVALHVEFTLHKWGEWGETATKLLHAWEPAVPAGVSLGRRLFRSGRLRELRERRAPIGQVVDDLARDLVTIDQQG